MALQTRCELGKRVRRHARAFGRLRVFPPRACERRRHSETVSHTLRTLGPCGGGVAMLSCAVRARLKASKGVHALQTHRTQIPRRFQGDSKAMPRKTD